MKTLSTLLLLSAVSLPLLAQTTPLKKPKTAHSVQKKQARSSVPVTPPAPAAAPVALTPDELLLAGQVYAGYLPCELGASVTIQADAAAPGYFHLQLGKQRFHMAPVATSTGAIRLEDRQAGAVWLQLANKSMLVSDKLGKRLVDACMNPVQVQVAQAMERNPTPSILDAVPPAPFVVGTAIAFTGYDE